MRIAFVGKGGSGKTTMSALFTQFMKTKGVPILAVDADLNMHLGELLGFSKIPEEMHLSNPSVVREIKLYLKGNNERIKDIVHFRKTTPPSCQSNLIILNDKENPLIKNFGSTKDNLTLMTVGSYDANGIGKSCYHNSLASFENILSHLVDYNGLVVSDMVAGVDAFANTLHVQFDMLVLVVEPTKRGVEVFNQYKELSETAEIYDSLYVIGNKVKTNNDIEFLKSHVPKEKILGFLYESDYLRQKDQEGGEIEIEKLENKEVLESIREKLLSMEFNNRKRLERLWDLHVRYVSQDFIKERFGDLTNQIDKSFDPEKVSK